MDRVSRRVWGLVGVLVVAGCFERSTPRLNVEVAQSAKVEDGQLCLDFVAEAIDGDLPGTKWVTFELRFPPELDWRLLSLADTVEGFPGATAETRLVRAPDPNDPDFDYNGVAHITVFFPDEGSEGITLTEGRHPGSMKFPVPTPIDTSQIFLTPIEAKSDGHVWDRDLLSSISVERSVAAATRRSTTGLSGDAPASWAPTDQNTVENLEVTSVGEVDSGADVVCDNLDLWNTSENTQDLGTCVVEEVVGPPGAQTLTELARGPTPFLANNFGLSPPVTLTATPSVLRVSCQAQAGFTGAQSVAVALNCDSQNRSKFVHSPVGGTPLDLPVVNMGQVVRVTGVPADDSIDPTDVPPAQLGRHTFGTTDTVSIEFEPQGTEQIHYQVECQDRLVQKGFANCAPDSGVGCIVNLTPPADPHGFLDSSIDRTSCSLLIGDDDPMTEEYYEGAVSWTAYNE